jgi:hypothetical protein
VNAVFSKKHRLDKYSNTLEWWTLFIPPIPVDNKEDTYQSSARRGGVSKSSIASWCSYTNTKVSIVNIGGPDHTFVGKYKPFTNNRFFQMLGVYIIDSVAPSLESRRAMQPQSKQQTYDNDFIV